MNKKFKIKVSLIAVFILVFGLNSFAFAGSEYTILSQGRFVDRNGTEDTSDDTVLFDSRDLVTLKTMVETGKTKVSTAINAYPNASVQTLDTFDNLSSAINNLTSVPDIYYYDKSTEGDSCVRYMYENGSYYPCNEYGEKTSDTALTGTITVVAKDDTTEPVAGETQLVKYERTGAANLSAGSAGYVDKTFILGSGSDNISYRNQARKFQKYYTFDCYTDKASCTVPEDAVLYENLFVCFLGGSVSEQLASNAHQIRIQNATITGNTLTISVYYPANTAATPHWYAEVYYAD